PLRCATAIRSNPESHSTDSEVHATSSRGIHLSNDWRRRPLVAIPARAKAVPAVALRSLRGAFGSAPAQLRDRVPGIDDAATAAQRELSAPECQCQSDVRVR